MASTIRIRAVASGDTTEVQALVQHPMDSGFVKDAQGNLIPPHYIEVVEFEHAGKRSSRLIGAPPFPRIPISNSASKARRRVTT